MKNTLTPYKSKQGSSFNGPQLRRPQSSLGIRREEG